MGEAEVASHPGGTRNPVVVNWPARIKSDNKPRDGFLHLLGVLPTYSGNSHISMPRTANGIEQKLLAGKSFLASFDESSFENRNSQLFERFNNRSMCEKGWKTNAQHTFLWHQNYAPGNWDENDWELYNLKSLRVQFPAACGVSFFASFGFVPGLAGWLLGRRLLFCRNNLCQRAIRSSVQPLEYGIRFPAQANHQLRSCRVPAVAVGWLKETVVVLPPNHSSKRAA